MRLLDLNPDDYRNATIFLDVDGTLVHDGEIEASPDIIAAVQRLKERSDVYLASNGGSVRTEQLAIQLGVHALPQLRKPLSHAAVHAIERRPRTVVIGDKYLTDGAFARTLGAEFVYLDPIRGRGESLIAQTAYGFDRIVPFVLLARPYQWIKNVLVFTPLFFAGALFVPSALASSIAAFFAFSIAASAVYVLNDLLDRAQDRLHPLKRQRPIAAGSVSVAAAILFILLLAVLEVVMLAAYPALIAVILIYVVMNGAYSAWLKHLAIVDIVCVASFYIMRIVGGGVATHIPLSPWIILCAFFAALFIIIGKRRAEYRHESKRRVLEQYSREGLDFMLAGSAALAIISYGLYTIIGRESPYLVYSTVFVVLALFRAMNCIYTHPDRAEAPEKLLFKDPIIFVSFILWAGYLFSVFYLA